MDGDASTLREPLSDAPGEAAPAWPLACTLCGEGLSRRGNALVCPRSHSFDVAREGYVNLLGGRRRPQTLGDSPEMLRARRTFLSRGYYAPLATALAAEASAHARRRGGSQPAIVCDVGCGEGYFTAAVHDGLAASVPGVDVRCYGIDVARDAARMAARRYGGIHFAVADTWQRLPLADATVDVLLNVFAPRNVAEFARVLRPDGIVLTAIPGTEHLAELRQRWGLLDIEEDKHARLLAAMSASFAASNERRLRYAVDLSGEAAAEIVAMGPSSRHLSAEVLATIAQAPDLRVGIAFDLLVFARLQGA